jgi:hypothetical protein
LRTQHLICSSIEDRGQIGNSGKKIAKVDQSMPNMEIEPLETLSQRLLIPNAMLLLYLGSVSEQFQDSHV